MYSRGIQIVRIHFIPSSYCPQDALNRIILIMGMYSYIHIPGHTDRHEHTQFTWTQTLSYTYTFYTHIHYLP